MIRCCVVAFVGEAGEQSVHRCASHSTCAAFAGQVDVFYGVNRDPQRAGFDTLHIPLDLALTVDFPVCRATITYGGTGYRAAMGWIQTITHSDRDGAPDETDVDLFPVQEAANSPFVTFGYAPTFFDAPANPTDPDMTWTARTFLTVCADAVRTQRVGALLGFRWGYALRGGQVTPLPLRATTTAEWNDQALALQERYLHWEFKQGVATGTE